MNENQKKELISSKKIDVLEKDAKVKICSDDVTYNLDKIGINELHQEKLYGNGIRVAILDTGIDVNNTELNIAGGVSFVEGSSYDDDNGHGTAIAGVISAKKDEKGLIGLAPNCELYAVKILDKNGEGYYSDIIKGIEWAIDHKVDIIVMSFGGTDYSCILEEVVVKANEKGALLVAAAGNTGKEVEYPARFKTVMSVGSVDRDNNVLELSNRGEELDVVAPGVDIKH